MICTSQAYAMLCLIKQTQCPYPIYARHISTKIASLRTIENVYSDILKIGDRKCSNAYKMSDMCEGQGCVRFAYTCTKNVEMQQRAQRRRDNYWLTVEVQLSPGSQRHGMQENIADHVKKLRFHFFELCELEKEAILLMQQAKKTDDFELYKKTFTLTAHKMRCLQRQVSIIHENSVLAKAVQDMKELHSSAIKFASTETLARWKFLCYNASRWGHPDEIIVYNKPDDKE